MVLRFIIGRRCTWRGCRIYRSFIVVILFVLCVYVFYNWNSIKHLYDLTPDVDSSIEFGQSDLHKRRDNDVKSKRAYHSVEGSVDHYCNSPFQPTEGSEGITPAGFKIQMVNVFIRHGDRTSLYNIPGYNPPKVSCHFESWYNGSDELFQKFPSRMRELRRNQSQSGDYFYKWPLLPSKENCSGGTLTGLGCLQHLNLGRHFSRVYLNLLDHKQQFKDQIIIKCTSTLRTYQSVIALLYGFLPNFHLSNILIENSPNLYFCPSKSVLFNSCVCKRAVDLKTSVKSQLKSMELESSVVNNIYSNIRNEFKFDISKLLSFSSVADVLVPEVCHGESTTAHRKLVNDMWREMKHQMLKHLNDSDKDRELYSSLIMMPVLAEISDRTKNLKEIRTLPKLWIYSGHDLTLTALLIVLGLHDGIWPPFASRVVMEIIENETGSILDKYFLRVVYNGRDVTKNLIFCRNKTYLGLCNVQYLEDFISQTILERYGYTGYNEACYK